MYNFKDDFYIAVDGYFVEGVIFCYAVRDKNGEDFFDIGTVTGGRFSRVFVPVGRVTLDRYLVG